MISPVTLGWRPTIASVSSVCPLPCTPAMARISPSPHGEADVVHDDLVPVVDHREVVDDEGILRPASAVPLLDGQVDRAADHHRGELLVGRARLRLADDLAEPDDGDAVRDLAHLAQLVGDEHDGGAGCLELAHDLHQLVGLLRGEHRGRLVEDEHLRVAGQRLDDLDPLLHADRQVVDERVGVDVEPEPRRDLPHLRASGVDVEHTGEPGLLMAEHDVLGDGEDGDEHEVLVHHADAGGHRVAGAGEVLDDVVEQDLALVGLVQPVEHVHQRRLAGAVLTEQGVDLAGLHGEVDVVVRDQRAEPLGDATKFKLHAVHPSYSRPG